MSSETTLNPAIHAAFRRDLHRFDDAFESFRGGDSHRAAALDAAWQHLSYQLDRHHLDEETYFWPAFRELGVDTAIIDALEIEHETMLAALEAANDAMAGFRSHPSSENAKLTRLAVADLHRVLGDHLEHEERDLDPFSIQHKDTRQHKACEKASRKAHAEGGGAFFAWLSDGCDESTASILRSEVPPPVLWFLVRFMGRDYNGRIASIW